VRFFFETDTRAYLISFLHSITLSIFYPHLSTCIIDIPDSFHHPNPLLKDHIIH